MNNTVQTSFGIAEIIGDKREKLLAIAAQYGAANVRVFGSVARGEAALNSDLDLLVDFLPNTSIYEMAGLLIELRALLGRDVDIADSATSKQRFLERIAPDVVLL